MESWCRYYNLYNTVVLRLTNYLEEMGYFKREEFVPNLEKLGVNDIDSLRTTLKSAEKEALSNTAQFTDLYKVCNCVMLFLLSYFNFPSVCIHLLL